MLALLEQESLADRVSVMETTTNRQERTQLTKDGKDPLENWKIRLSHLFESIRTFNDYADFPDIIDSIAAYSKLHFG